MFTKVPRALATSAATAILLLTLLFLTLSEAWAAPAAGSLPAEGADRYYALTVEINRTAVPAEVAFHDLTLLVDSGGAESMQVSAADGRVTSRYDAATGKHVVTTDAGTLHFLLKNPADLTTAGTVEKAPLNDDRQWAWSHGMDDNRLLRASMQVMEDHGWRGTLYIVGEYLSYADRGWDPAMLSTAEVQQALADGWSVGNHSWLHECGVSEPIMHQTVISTYQRLRDLIAGSSRSDYRVTAFAAPCMDDAYVPVVEQIMADDLTNLLFNETAFWSGGDYYNYYRIIVDPGASQAPTWNTAVFDPGLVVGRDFTIDGSYDKTGDGKAGEAIATIDNLVAESGPDRHLWYNSGGHGGEEGALDTVADHVLANYGPESAKPAWVAPSDEIFNYLLVRDNSAVSVSGPHEVVPAGFTTGEVRRSGDDLTFSYDHGDGAGWHELHRGSTPYFTPGAATRIAGGWGPSLTYTDEGVLATAGEVYYLVRTFQAPATSSTEPARAGAFDFQVSGG